jgi:hypothetical protein
MQTPKPWEVHVPQSSQKRGARKKQGEENRSNRGKANAQGRRNRFINLNKQQRIPFALEFMLLLLKMMMRKL